jgi:ABC-type protease/lipase transport system fused ATPase/permease subunit
MVLEKISWPDRMKNEEVLGVDEEQNILQAIKRRMAIWIGRILHRNCLLEHVIQEKIEMMGRRGRRCNQLLNDLKEMREFWK